MGEEVGGNKCEDAAVLSGDGERRESLRASGGWMENGDEGAWRQTVKCATQTC